MRGNIDRLAEKLKEAGQVELVSHMNPDGDTIGSALATQRILDRLGIPSRVYCRDRAPEPVDFLPGAAEILPLTSLPEHPQVLMFLDCADYDRVASPGDPGRESLDRAFTGADVTLQMDHHVTNPGYCGENVVENTSAAGVLVHELARSLNVPLDREIAECLYVALATDTGNFTQNNTDSASMRVMADILETGFDLVPVCRRLFTERRPQQARLIGEALRTLTFAENGHVAFMSVSREAMERAGARDADAENLVNFARDITGVHMAFLARETQDGIRVNIRSIAPWTIHETALSLGGGGHRQASGVTLKEHTLEAAVQEIAGRLAESHRQQEKA